MKQISVLQKKAIKAAKNLNWPQAISINQKILSFNESDIAALNRLGLALMQQKNIKRAKKIFNKVILIDKSNIIANKHLKKLKNNQVANVLPFSTNSYFIEEPGKTKIVDLHRLAGKQILCKLAIGQKCKLSPKNRYVSVETEDGCHIGALPEDISFRLTKLINRGNEYCCIIHSCDEKRCSVHVKESKTSKRNAHLQSFPQKSSITAAEEIDNPFILEDHIPVQTSTETVTPTPNIDEALEKINNRS